MHTRLGTAAQLAAEQRVQTAPCAAASAPWHSSGAPLRSSNGQHQISRRIQGQIHDTNTNERYARSVLHRITHSVHPMNPGCPLD